MTVQRPGEHQRAEQVAIRTQVGRQVGPHRAVANEHLVGAGMEAQRQAGFLDGRPHRLQFLAVPADAGRRVRHLHGLVAELLDLLHVVPGRFGLQERRQDGHAVHALRIGLEILDQPFVVDINTGPVQFLVLQAVQRLEHAVEDHRRVDVFRIHVLELQGRVVLSFATDGDLVSGALRQEVTAFGLENDAFHLAIPIEDRRPVLPLRRQALLVKMVDFHVVVVGGHDAHAGGRHPAVCRRNTINGQWQVIEFHERSPRLVYQVGR